MENIPEILLDALVDSVKLLPFLYLVYLAIELIEHRGGERFRTALAKAGRFGPALGALIGLVPQCGFSVAAAGFYARGVITEGTLLAVFLSTSDEALPILLTDPTGVPSLLPIIISKLVIAMAAGFLLDLVLYRRQGAIMSEKRELGHASHAECGAHASVGKMLFEALKRTAFIFIFLLIVNAAIGLAVGLVGEEQLWSFLMGGSVFQPVLTALVGLIPNCAPSIIIAEAYLAGGLTFGSTVAGLCTGAGAGLLVLFRTNKNVKENLLIVAVLYVAGAASGMIINLFV